MDAGMQIGTYRLLQRIGEGGMGVVWMAEHVMLGRRAAIKVLHREYSTQPSIVQRFFNEARAATSISDPGIVQIFDFGQHTDGSAYIVMELLEGETLDRRLARVGAALGVGEALVIVRQVAASLGTAHARGIIHRDLKPENIFLVYDPEVPGGQRAKIVDFGIAKLVGEASKTNTSAVMGTPTYMSPEQCRGAGHVDQRSDIYALGCVLMTLVTGKPPFVGEGAGDLIAMHLREAPPIASSRVPSIPSAVDALIARCLAKSPAERFSSGHELANAIGALLTQPSITTAPQMRTMVEASATKPTTLSALTGSESVIPPPPRSRALLFALVGVVVAGGAGTAIVLASGGGADKPVEAATAAPKPTPVEVAKPVATPPVEAPKPAKAVEKPAIETQLEGAVAALASWAPAHAGAACPTAKELELSNDPWGHALVVTCTDQPGDQMFGVISSGPDGKAGTADDVTSWSLAREIAARVHGARWVATIKKKPEQGVKKPPPDPTVKTGAFVDLDGDGIPDQR